MPFFSYIIVAIAAYLLGSLPTGFLVARARGMDIRTVGSGNIGATNAFRVLGKPAGIFVLVIDALKGFAATAWISPLIYNWIEPHYSGLAPGFHAASPELQMRYKVIAGICAVLGHNYTCWLKFKGGKGIATTGGVYFALAPLAAGIALASWVVLTILTRYVSVGSIAAAIALAASVWIFEKNLLLGIVTTALAALAIFKHKKNIQRLMAGTENRIGKKTSAAEGSK